MYNCKIVSLIGFLFTPRKKEKKREKHGESVVLLSSLSLFARSMRERKGKDIDVIGFPQLLKIEFSSFLKEEQKPRFSSYFSTFG